MIHLLYHELGLKHSNLSKCWLANEYQWTLTGEYKAAYN